MYVLGIFGCVAVALIVSSVIREGFAVRDGVSSMYIDVDRRYLSSQYELRFSPAVEYWVYGEVVGVLRVGGSLSDEERGFWRDMCLGGRLGFTLCRGS